MDPLIKLVTLTLVYHGHKFNEDFSTGAYFLNSLIVYDMFMCMIKSQPMPFAHRVVLPQFT